MRTGPTTILRALPGLFFLLVLFPSCEWLQNMTGIGASKSSGPSVKGTPCIVIGNDVMLHSGPSVEMPVTLLLGLGETVYWTGDTVVDHQDDSTVYLKVALSDGKTTGWASKKMLVPDAYPAALKHQTRIYRRPDSLAVTDARFEFMDMVAVISSSGEWIRVSGAGGSREGWIRGDAVLDTKEDVASAIFARKIIRRADGKTRKEKFDFIILNAPYIESYFVEQIRNMSALEAIFETEGTPRPEEQSGEESWVEQG